ncbi:poly(ADP-ribose) glycohydrolase ARH3-like, partial [Elysia marginata]
HKNNLVTWLLSDWLEEFHSPLHQIVSHKMTLSRFKGSLVGAVIADCIGALFEGRSTVSLSSVLESANKLERYRQIQREHGTRPADTYGLQFTDDTAMVRSVAASLLEKKVFDAQDMAKRFTDEYFKEPDRGYGSNVVTVFKGLRNSDLKDVYEPARAQFEGSGSYGNGGAMRIAPVPLFAFTTQKSSDLQSLVTDVTRLTHTNVLGVHGAILEAFAIDQILRLETETDFDADVFITHLVDKMRKVETDDDDNSPKPSPEKQAKRQLDASPTPYTAKLERIKELYSQESLETKVIVDEIGHDVSALDSVPTAILAFLRAATKPIPGLEDRNKFEQTVLYAISLGGDTDTIATMAAAIAGALYGMETIPEAWQYYCEGVADAETMAEELYKLGTS